jgi:hypothetical protein
MDVLDDYKEKEKEFFDYFDEQIPIKRYILVDCRHKRWSKLPKPSYGFHKFKIEGINRNYVFPENDYVVKISTRKDKGKYIVGKDLTLVRVTYTVYYEDYHTYYVLDNKKFMEDYENFSELIGQVI